MATKGKFKTHLNITKELLEDEWITNRLSQSKIAEKYNVPLSTIESRIKAYGLTRAVTGSHYTMNISKISLENPIFCYYLGLVVTDGYVNSEKNYISLRLCNDGSKEVLQNILNYFEYTGTIKEYKTSTGKIANDLTIFSKELILFFKSLGINGAKTYYCPYINLIDDCKFMFWRGVLDGDGNIKVTINKNSSRLTFRLVMACESFIIDMINDINHTLNLDVEISKHKGKGVEYPKIEMKKEATNYFLDSVYKNVEYADFRLPDKYDRYIKNR